MRARVRVCVCACVCACVNERHSLRLRSVAYRGVQYRCYISVLIAERDVLRSFPSPCYRLKQRQSERQRESKRQRAERERERETDRDREREREGERERPHEPAVHGVPHPALLRQLLRRGHVLLHHSIIQWSPLSRCLQFSDQLSTDDNGSIFTSSGSHAHSAISSVAAALRSIVSVSGSMHATK